MGLEIKCINEVPRRWEQVAKNGCHDVILKLTKKEKLDTRGVSCCAFLFYLLWIVQVIFINQSDQSMYRVLLPESNQAHLNLRFLFFPSHALVYFFRQCGRFLCYGRVLNDIPNSGWYQIYSHNHLTLQSNYTYLTMLIYLLFLLIINDLWYVNTWYVVIRHFH